jgi:hypothetical protein
VTGSVPRGGDEDLALQALNKQIVEAFGMVRGVTHTEFIRAHEDGQFYFLETAARVGGAGTDMLIAAESGLNMWAEWAKIEADYLRGNTYRVQESSENYAALMVCLTGDEWPDTSQFNAPEIVWRMPKAHHVGMVVASPDYDRVQQLVREYVPILSDQYMAVAPPMDSATG